METVETLLRRLLVVSLLAGGLVALPSSGVGVSNNVPVYTLAECINIGLERAVPLANARRDEEISRQKIVQARSEALPQLSLESLYTRTAEPIIYSEEFDNSRADNLSAVANLGQLLFAGGKVSAAIEAAKHYREFARNATEDERQQLILQITGLFNDIVLVRNLVEVAADSVAQLTSFVAQTEEKFKSDKVAEFDLLSARVRLQNERPILIEAQNLHELAKEQFRNVVNLRDKNFELAGTLSYQSVTNSLDYWQAKAVENRPALKKMAQQVMILEQDVKVAKADYWPQVSAFADYGGGEPDVNDGKNKGWGWFWQAGVGVSFDVFDGFFRRANIAEKKLNLAKNQADYEQAQRDVATEVKQYYLLMIKAAETESATRETVALAEKNLAIAKTRYQAGLGTYLEFTDTNHALSEAKYLWYKALRDHMNAVAGLEFASGIIKEPGLHKVEEMASL